jgi:preprotein translocase subunit SecB
MDQNEQPVSVEVPHAPEIFLEREAPQIEIQLGTSGRAIGEGVYEVVLTVTVTAKMQEKAVFLVEIGQGGIFRILNVPNEQIEPLVAVACPNILFPAMYMQRLQEQAAAPHPTEVTIQ